MQGDVLDTNLATALSKANINVNVTETPGGTGIADATVEVQIAGASTITCENCAPGNLLTTDTNGSAIFILSNVPSTPAQIDFLVYSVPGFVETAATTQVVSFATINFEIALSSDTTAPVVAINSPTSGTTWAANSSPLAIGGSASDNAGVTQVTWSNSMGGAGTCSGTTTWSATGIILYSGTNVVTVTARDAAGNTGTDTVNVSYVTSDCTFTIAPTSRELVADGATYDVTVTSSDSYCEWTTSENSAWISLLPTSGTGNDTVRVTVSANTGAARSTEINIAEQSHTVNQDSLTPQTGSLRVTISPAEAISAGARWRVDEGNWRTSGDTQSGLSVGNHQVEFNTISGWTTPGNQTATINNNETTNASGTYSQLTIIISGYMRDADDDSQVTGVTVTFSNGGGTATSDSVGYYSKTLPFGWSGTATPTKSCWSFEPASRPYNNVTSNLSQQNFFGFLNRPSISPTSQSVASTGAAYDVTVTATGDCVWGTSENYNWISLSPTSGTGNDLVRVTVSANTGEARLATITIAGKSHNVNQDTNDITSPTIPTGVTITPSGYDYIFVDWNASWDNVGVQEYRLNFCISDGNTCISYWTTPVSHPDTSLYWNSDPNTWYCVMISACDAANNCSDFSETVCTQTP